MVKVFLNDYLTILIFYFATINLFSIVLIFATMFRTTTRRRKYPLLDDMNSHRPSVPWPAISIVAPAHNEEKSIVGSVKSLLALNYPQFEVIVVNDGSVDKTVEVLKNAFHMTPVLGISPLGGGPQVTKFQSTVNPNLSLISKPQGGKADALNVGVLYTKYDLFCAIDSDSLLEPDALLRVAIPFIENPKEAVASGGTVRVVNGSLIRGSRVVQFGLPKNLWALLQMVEYSRTFLFGRSGWSQLGSNLLISGAFGLFNKRAVLEVGGYNTDSIGEDMELVVRLHSHFLKNKQPYQIEYNADPVCWTEVPSTFRGLYRQRHRWQRGLADSLLRQKHMFLNPRYGIIGLVGMPYQVFVELLGPAIEISAFLALAVGFFGHYVSAAFSLLFLSTSILFSMTISVLTVLVEKHQFSRHWTIGNLTVLIGVAWLENFGYRQLLSVWRFLGLIGFMRGNVSWGTISRTGFSEDPKSEALLFHDFLSTDAPPQDATNVLFINKNVKQNDLMEDL